MFEACPCGAGGSFAACCGRLHAGAEAAGPEAVMRARYTAFARGDDAYLRRSWAPETCPPRILLDPERAWTGLTVTAADAHGDQGTVAFEARWRSARRKGVLKEESAFRRDPSLGWLYVGPA